MYQNHYALVYRVAHRILRNALDAEDVTQTIFLKLWSNPDAFRGGNVEGWLTRASRNCAIDVLRKRKHELLQAPIDAVISWVSADNVSDQVTQRLILHEVLKELLQLREDQRALVTAAYFGGVSHVLLAQTTALPLGTVKTLIRSGIMRLREKVSDELNVVKAPAIHHYVPRPNGRGRRKAVAANSPGLEKGRRL